MRSLLFTLSLATLSALAAGCRSSGGPPPDARTGESLYTKVGMHFDAKGGKYVMYSTNYVGMPKFVPPGTRMTYQGTRRNEIRLTDEDGANYEIEFVAKHSLMSMQEWMDRNFGDQPFQMPGGLSDQEQQAIGTGTVEPGMSREAVFLAIGYPPKSLSPSESDSTLTYQRNRIMRYHVRFGDDDRVVDVSR